ncbi:MAG TPA: peptidase M28 [Idiomarina baltica]|jgi:Zn-dependent M28 family amino/carboxypeptidase|uniref:Peptidase M28 n=4 Tax=Idiomarina TaxID=135575 RepID=A0A348WR33_9GAMM|nr:M28 family metallopeptidase [Idiomarina sp. T82-3]KXS35774.1 MAG: aminopeptidase [Idiomarina sp. T82-3]MAF75580.1 peptidase M28 [Idiomarinaceae bacterium]MBL73503.1 peptidase M28 [Idiomarinaceae bacterium]HAR56995.1 peptidase M28 [Idiomarina baltica]
MKPLIISAVALAVLTACGPQQSQDTSAAEQTKVDKQPADLKGSAFNPNFRDYLKTISSDEFEGREPASAGEEKVVSFIENHFREWGLKPIDKENDSYRQPFPLVKIMPYKVSDMTFSGDNAPEAMKYRTEMMAWTMQVTDEVDLSDSDMVFVGYGIVAPEYDWNDYEGLDVEGKTVVMFVNDPGYATQDPELFNGNAMTYYGRWTYKYEEAARQGAAGALIIHETGPAGYGWGVVAGGSPVRFDLKRENNNMDRAKIEGWITKDSAEKLFAKQGMTLEDARQKALSDDFEAMPLNAQASVSVKNKFEFLDTNNVVGYIEGTKYPEEHVIYMAHHDHLGTDPVREDDPIYNGAQDNASGTAGLLAIAEKFAQQPAPERSIVFAAVGAEESGLLGSAWYADHPLFPLAKAVGGINMDVMNVYGPMKDLVVIGYGNSEMDEYVQPFLEEQGRYLTPNPTPEAGFFYRSDHFNLAKKGVPMLYAEGGNDHITKGKEWTEEQRAKYVAEAYHKPADEYNPDWDLRGTQQDLSAFYQLGRSLANSRDWPQWAEGNEFEAIRKETEEQRK